MLFFVLFNLLVVLVVKCFSHDLPAYFPRCSIDDPDLNNCIVKAANALRPHVRKGIKEIGLPSFDPLVIPTFYIAQEIPNANFTVTVWNYTVQGMDNYDIKEIQYDPKTLTFQGKAEFGSIPISCVYEMQGSVASIPIIGKGNAQVTLGPINATFEINGEMAKRKGVEHYKPIGTKVRMIVEDGSFHLGGLFNGNEARARVTNQLLNQNSKLVVDAVTPALEQLSEKGLLRIMTSLAKAVPYHKLFPRSH